jgi:tetratricopeptide (TPR) repeat protein
VGGDRLRPYWDFGDLDASAARFRVLLAEEKTGPGRAEVLTQLARVEGLHGDFEAAERLLAEADALAGSSGVARVRVDTERGRALRSSGDATGALPLFEAAFAAALDAGEDFLAADAAHMAAIAAPDRAAALEWTQRGLELAEASIDAEYWAGPLLNNLGWSHHEDGDHGAALEAFERALAARERRPGEREEIEIARYAVARALRALNRPGEAVAHLERAVSWTRETGKPDGWFHEELAEAYAALGDTDKARRHARLALDLLPEADPSFDGDAERVARVHRLAAEGAD